MSANLGCDARIRPFRPAGEDEFPCEKPVHHVAESHEAIIRDRAYKGSETRLSWADDDRRTFRGEFKPCTIPGCILPAGHPRKCSF